MFTSLLVLALCPAHYGPGMPKGVHVKHHYPPIVLDGHGHPGYHNLGGWGLPYGGYGFTGYYCPDHQQYRPVYSLPLQPLIVPPPGAFCQKDDEDEDPPGTTTPSTDKGPSKDPGEPKDPKNSKDPKDPKSPKNSDEKPGKKKDDTDDPKKKDEILGKPRKLPDPMPTAEVGWVLVDLSADLVGSLNLPKGSKGTLIVSVDQNGLAADAKLKAGMLIVRVEGKQANSVRAVEQALTKGSLQKGVKLEVMDKNGDTRTFTLRSEEE